MNITIKSTNRYYGDEPAPGKDRKDPASYSPKKIPVEFCVVHCTEGFRGGDEEIFLGKSPTKEASIHFYITKDPVEVMQFVPPGEKAWHAGPSRYELDGKEWSGFNNFSIGIELGSWSPTYPVRERTTYTGAQMQALVDLHKQLQEQFPALKDPKRTVGHDDISGYRGKTDPGSSFDWGSFRRDAFGDDHDEEFSVRVNGKKLPSKLIMVEGKAYLPLRSVSEALGLQVAWFGKEKRVELSSKP